MDQKNRIKILKKLAQSTTSSSTTTSTPATPTTTQQSSNIDARSLPNAKSYLFDGVSWTSLNSIFNKINSGLQKFSNNQLTVQSVVVKTPNSGASAYTGSLRNLIVLIQWLYKTITLDRKNVPYSKDDIKKIITDFNKTLSSQSFPEPGADQIKSNLVNSANSWAAKLQ